MFKYLREEVVLKTETPRSVDISGECAAMLEDVMVAQVCRSHAHCSLPLTCALLPALVADDVGELNIARD